MRSIRLASGYIRRIVRIKVRICTLHAREMLPHQLHKHPCRCRKRCIVTMDESEYFKKRRIDRCPTQFLLVAEAMKNRPRGNHVTQSPSCQLESRRLMVDLNDRIQNYAGLLRACMKRGSDRVGCAPSRLSKDKRSRRQIFDGLRRLQAAWIRTGVTHSC